MPVGKADKILDSKDGCELPLFERKEIIIEELIIYVDDASIVDGAPTGIQIVGWRFQDEQTLMATEVIADALRA